MFRGDAYRLRLTQPLTGFCFLLSLICAMGDFEQTQFGCSLPKRGTLFSGSRNITHTKRGCQKWAVNQPHVVDPQITDDQFPDGSKEAAVNFCRNPQPTSRDGVWCYTTDVLVEWEYCDVCPGNYEGYNGCAIPNKGYRYKGKLAHTASFAVCEPWTKHVNTEYEFPDASVEEAKNYCRNPSGKDFEAPWCFVEEWAGVTWDYCDICKPFQGHVTRYRNERAENLVGERIADLNPIACLRWCVNMDACVGVNAARDLSHCYIITKLKYKRQQTLDIDNYSVQRVCIPKTKGEDFYFLIYPDLVVPKTGDKFLGDVASCEKHCVEDPNCVVYSRNNADQTCLFQSTILDPIDVNVPETLSKFRILCAPSIKSSADVMARLKEIEAEKAALEGIEIPTENPAGNATEKPAEETLPITQSPLVATVANSDEVTTKKPKRSNVKIILAVVIVIIIIAIVLGAYAHFKLGFFKAKQPATPAGPAPPATEINQTNVPIAGQETDKIKGKRKKKKAGKKGERQKLAPKKSGIKKSTSAIYKLKKPGLSPSVRSTRSARSTES